MLDHALCVKLKEHGFPQDSMFDREDSFYCDGEEPDEETRHYHEAYCKDKHVRKPTLSELIYSCSDWFECGNEFGEDRGLYFCPYMRSWQVFKKSELLEDLEMMTDGDTPEEAVAHLFISLNPIK